MFQRKLNDEQALTLYEWVSAKEALLIEVKQSFYADFNAGGRLFAEKLNIERKRAKASCATGEQGNQVEVAIE